MDRIELPVGDLRYRALAEGPADGRLVLLLHGFPQGSGEWTSQLAALGAAGYRAVAPDQRGYSPGARPDGIEPYGIDHLVADVLAMCDELGAHQIDLVGHDWGGIVAWAVACRYPERLRTLTAVSVPHPEAFADAYASDASKQHEMSSYIDVFRAPDGSGEAMLAGVREAFPTLGLTVLDEDALTPGLNWYRATHPTKMRGYAPVSVPTLYVWSTEDPAISREAAEGCARYVTGPFTYEVFEGVDHWVPELAADRLTALVLEHLARS
jgi:pimeloyl-ACP methyl ester carboxylesterase